MLPQDSFLMGSETEYAVSGVLHGKPVTPPEVAGLLCRQARLDLVHLADMESPSGVYLQNGGRLYCDINGHNEYASPECTSPEQVAAFDKASEQILAELARKVERDHPGLQIRVTKNNLSPVQPDSCSFGNHESYTAWVKMKRAAAALIPHLVTRLPYAGSGCFSHHPEGSGFELSQRARFLVRSVGSETTSDRAIFCTRVRKLSDSSETGWTRVHLIGKDSQRAPWGTYLTFGVTGLLFWILNHGGRVGQGLALAEPVVALRRVSLDPALSTLLILADGRRMNAAEVQEAYLAQAESWAQRHELPAWGSAVLRHWRHLVELLSKDPRESLAGLLDPYTKLHLYGHALERAGYTWESLKQALILQEQLRAQFPSAVVRALVDQDPAPLTGKCHEALTHAQSLVDSAGPGSLDRLRFALRLQVLDQKYHEIGGLYDNLARAGHVESVVLTDAEIVRATTTAPPGGRAALRAGLVREHHGQGNWAVSWQYVVNRATGEGFDLSDPFSAELKPSQPSPQSPLHRSWPGSLFGLLRQVES